MGGCLFAPPFLAMRYHSRSYLDLAFLTGLNLFNYMDRYVLASVIPPLKEELQLSNAGIGWLTSAFMIGYFATSPIFGYLGDRAPRKGLIAFGVFAWSLGTILTSFSHSYGSLLACRILVGLGEASYATLAPAWLADRFPVSRRNMALTIFYTATPLGSALGYLVGGFALDHGGWRTAFLWAGAPGLLLALLLLTLAEPPRGAEDPSARPLPSNYASGKAGLRTFVALFRIRDFNLVLLGYTAYTFALGAFAAWGPTFLNQVHGLELAAADRFFGAVLVFGGLAGTLIGGLAATRLQRKLRSGYALLLSVATALSAAAATAALFGSDRTMSMICLAAAMFLAFLPTGPITTLLIESVPPTARASAMAASIFVIHLFGDFWSPVIVGGLADLTYSTAAGGSALQSAMLILPAMLGLAALSWGWLGSRQQCQGALA
jgi:MFS transporter, Spinster family, sphingosine-1-phosphate transporter